MITELLQRALIPDPAGGYMALTFARVACALVTAISLTHIVNATWVILPRPPRLKTLAVWLLQLLREQWLLKLALATLTGVLVLQVFAGRGSSAGGQTLTVYLLLLFAAIALLSVAAASAATALARLSRLSSPPSA